MGRRILASKSEKVVCFPYTDKDGVQGKKKESSAKDFSVSGLEHIIKRQHQIFFHLILLDVLWDVIFTFVFMTSRASKTL